MHSCFFVNHANTFSSRIKAKFGNKVFKKLNYYKTNVFQRLANKYFSFSLFSILEKNFTPFSLILKKNTVSENTSIWNNNIYYIQDLKVFNTLLF
jgi:hypothetical protein